VQSGPSRIPFELRLVALGLALVAPALLLSLWLLYRLELKWLLRSGAAAAICALGFYLVRALRAAVVVPLRSLTSVVDAYRNGDYTVRSNHEQRADALGDLAHEINTLGNTLRQQRLRAMEATALLEKLIAAIDMAILVFNERGQLRVYNPVAAQLLNLHEQDKGQIAADLGLPEFPGNQASSRMVTELAGQSGRWQITQGSFREEGVAQHLLIIADVRQALRQEERVAWQRLIRVIGHEVNNSLTPIQSLAVTLQELLGATLVPGGERDSVLDGLKVISDRAHKLNRFLAQYSRLARLPPPNLSWIMLAPVLRRMESLYPLQRIEVEVEEQLQAEVDEAQLEQVLINLARNAVEAQGEAGGRVVLRAYEQQHNLIITLTDEGPGIANPDNLFVPFFTTKPAGSGVGLVLSRQIAEAHGGSLSLENRTEGSGCIAVLRIPRAARRRTARGAPEMPPRAHDGAGP
jgi:two-component system nitrogen regulation sensor histidine kinase NtrY